ncbi:peptide MFS transporter [Flavobacterium salilacus subsp. salilacus]|uniref:peptide MFS transporter n=1 Tax=Flavobacterium TaxID=237 RepID=UPI0010752A7A|nr:MULTISPECIES: peptide MFS transporter [Flavobacterium]KAF2519966.1 peptide MFS transporter [Flavobacterium salilacus subsp. salilacus]MBE1614122.1 peptide MFS transporter [Flavobacterium sp. SaA2.13]
MEKTTSNDFFKSNVLGHPAGLFVLFFTEMWERFSYYGMRALLVIFLISTYEKGGWEWTTERALGLYGTYTMGVYLTPVLGGLIADRLLGYRWAVIIGAFIMTLGHASMAVETELFLYIGLGCLIVGNGLFKPNMTSMISNLYKDHPEKKDGAYSLFYMGVNAGAFLGIMLCGYIGEKVSWSLGFGLAGIFMFFGMLQFYFTQNIFGDVGLSAKKTRELKKETKKDDTPSNIVFDRLIVVFIFSVFTVFFWAAFEQAGGSMTIFADKYTQRVLEGNAGMTFKIIDAILTIVPLAIITYVLIKLFSKTFKKYALGNIILSISFIIIWCIVLWKVNREFADSKAEVPATWFGILNSLFIITFAPLFSKWWESKYNLPGAIKFGLGLILLGVGFGFLAYGAISIEPGATDIVRVSMVWLIFAYLFHTLGELCLSPVGLSYVSKLVPAAWIGMMFGVYYLFIAMGNKIAGSMGGMIEKISEEYSLSTFFLIFTIVPIGLGIIISLLNPLIKKLMHGVR